jgi:hypothetical protein
MARTEITVTEASPAGVAPGFQAADAANGMKFRNNHPTILLVRNGGASPITVTVETSVTVEGIAVPDRLITVPAGGDRVIGPFLPAYYDQSGADRGFVFVEFSADTSVTVAAIHI